VFIAQEDINEKVHDGKGISVNCPHVVFWAKTSTGGWNSMSESAPAVLSRTPVFWDVTLCRSVVPDVSKDRSFFFKVRGVQEKLFHH
jgi:hypothetical protein